MRSYLDAISMTQDPAGAYNNLAETYKDQDELDQAVAAFRKALAAQPDLGPAYSNLLYLYASTRHISPEAERALAEGWERSILTGGGTGHGARKRRSILRRPPWPFPSGKAVASGHRLR